MFLVLNLVQPQICIYESWSHFKVTEPVHLLYLVLRLADVICTQITVCRLVCDYSIASK